MERSRASSAIAGTLAATPKQAWLRRAHGGNLVVASCDETCAEPLRRARARGAPVLLVHVQVRVRVKVRVRVRVRARARARARARVRVRVN